MADEIRADYVQLRQVATQLARQATAISQMQQRVQRQVGQLRSAWVGQGADGFYTEMNERVLPATARLSRALQDASKTTQQMSAVMAQAENEAAALFRSGSPTAMMPIFRTLPYTPPFPDVTMGDRADNPWRLKGEGDIWEFDYRSKDQRSKFDPEVKIRYGVSGAVVGDPEAEGVSVLGGGVGVEGGWGPKGWSAGPYLEAYAARANTEGVLIGDENLGLTGGLTGKAIALEGFAGLRHNSVGASIGGTLVSVEGELGTNVAGVNVGVTGELGLKAELGFEVGAETELKLPFVSVGFRFGGAKRPDEGMEAI